jgi:hypothetical protein
MKLGRRLNLTPLYAYAPRGERAVGKIPRNDGANLTLIASLSLSGMGEAMLLDGSTDGIAFETSLEQILAALPAPWTGGDFGPPLDSPGTSGKGGHRSQKAPVPVSPCLFAQSLRDSWGLFQTQSHLATRWRSHERSAPGRHH